MRLVEALEMYDNGAMDSYLTEESMESAALLKSGIPGPNRRKVGALHRLPSCPLCFPSQIGDMVCVKWR